MPAHSTICPKCEGKGKVSIAEHLEETLACFPKLGGRTAEEIAPRLKITNNAASNRLSDLLDLGLLRRTREGKFWRYSRA